MVKAIIYISLITLSASSVLAAVPGYQRREVSEDDLLARAIIEESPEAMISREVDIAILEEREPFFGFLAPLIGMVTRTAVNIGAKAGVKAAARAGTKAVKHTVKENVKDNVKQKINNNSNNNKKKKRELAPDDLVDELGERELDIIIEREIDEDDILLGREVEDDFYLD